MGGGDDARLDELGALTMGDCDEGGLEDDANLVVVVVGGFTTGDLSDGVAVVELDDDAA